MTTAVAAVVLYVALAVAERWLIEHGFNTR